MGDLYEADIVKWSQQQAELLRRIAAGEPVNEAPDWPNIVDEVESLGRSETRACASLLAQALLHDLKLAAWPDSTAAPGWAEEARRFRWEAREAFAPSMRRRRTWRVSTLPPCGNCGECPRPLMGRRHCRCRRHAR